MHTRLGGDEWWRYEWEFNEGQQSEEAEPERLGYFDFAAGDGAAFCTGNEGFDAKSARAASEETESQRDNSAGKDQERHEKADEPVVRRPTEPVDRFSAAQAFCKAFANSLGHAAIPSSAAIAEWLLDLARQCGPVRAYASASVDLLVG